MEIRDATIADADAACEVLRQSIVQLCEADHRNDPAILNRWLGSKTPDIVAGWATQPGNSLLVAVDAEEIVAVGSVTDRGEITLNCVAPQARFRGVSRAVLKALEARALQRGNTACHLSSTETAHRFYCDAGYVDAGAPRENFGTTSGYPMVKQISGTPD
jgi:GNAT superfamily N-acetyltransferase